MQKRFSQKREDIRNLLAKQGGGLSAATIHTALPHIDLTTIYRNLDQFVADGDVKKILLGGEALYEYQMQPHHHAVCDECQRVIHFTAPDNSIINLLNLPDFAISHIELTVHGRCHHQIA